MSPKVIGDVVGMVNVDYSLMAYLTRGTPDMAKFCYEGTSTPKAGCTQISRLELNELNIRSSQRRRIENWIKDVQSPIGVYPPNYLQVEPPLPKSNYPTDCYWPWFNHIKKRGEPGPRFDPPELALRTVDKTFTRTDSVNLSSQQVLPVVPKMPSIDAKSKPFERERNPVTPPNWGAQYEQLADAYLEWKSERDPSALDAPPEPDKDDSQNHTLHPTSIQVFGKTWFLPQYTINLTFTTSAMRTKSPNVILISHGLLSNAQWSPQWAISLSILEEFHTLRTDSSRSGMAIEKFLRPICESQGIQYNTSLYNRFRLAYAVFVGILRTTRKRQKSNEGNGDASQLLSGNEGGESGNGATSRNVGSLHAV